MNPVFANALISFEPGLVIWIAVTFVIFLLILKKFAWGPLLDALDEREKNIQESLDSAEKAMKRAEEISQKNDVAIREAEIAAQRIRKEAKEEAEQIRAEIIEKARSEAEKVKEQTLSSIDQEKKKAMLELRDLVADLSIQAAKTILRSELDEKKNKKLVDDFIKDLSKNSSSMMSSKAARRYASALLGFAIETNKVSSVLTDIELIKDTVDGSRDLVVFLKSPVIKDDKKMEVLSELFQKRISKETWKFFELLKEKSRLELLPAVTHAFIQAYYVYAGIIEAEVLYSETPDAKQLSAIQSALESKTGKKVKLSTRLSADLIGGLVIKLDDTVVDGSVKNKLQQLEHLFYKSAI
jgi:F-type H+-transporting ATPase subunit b